MRCGSLQELLHMVLYENRADAGWDQICLTLHDPEYNFHRLLDSTGTALSDFPDLFLTDSLRALDVVFEAGRQPVLGPYRGRQHAALFRKSEQRLGSVAVLPLIRNRKLIGSLNLGSYDWDRFKADSSTDFLEHLAAVLSVCLETSEIRERLRYIGLMDGLTGVNNRRFFDQRLQEEVERARRENVPLGFLFIDLDHFKAINDTHGHQVGDDVLREVARLIREQLRSVDVVARYGGEEFAVLLSQADMALSSEIAERIRKHIETGYFGTGEHEVSVTASIGVATTQDMDATESVESMSHHLVEAADEAVYRAKESGRNRVITTYHEPSTV